MIFQIITLFLAVQATMSASTVSVDDVSPTLSNSEFSTDLFTHIVKDADNSKNNLIYSPASIHTCLALAYFGSVDETAKEFVTGLHFESSDKLIVQKQFEHMLEVTRGPAPLIKIANKIYTNKGYELMPNFNEIAKQSFGSEAETLDFSEQSKAVNTINDWVAEHTDNKIKDFVSESNVSPETQMLLVNAIHFKGNWKFPLYVRDGEFFNAGVEATKTQLMSEENDFLYADLNELGATALKMPYNNSEFSMLLILPKEKTGLYVLEERLKEINLLKLAGKLRKEDVSVTIPKFKIETQLDMNSILKDMGMKTMFTDNAKFSFFTHGDGNSKVGYVLHKAFIDVNERGTEAAAATGLQIVPTSLNLNQKFFYANHPFFFAIMDNNNVYFTGHLVTV